MLVLCRLPRRNTSLVSAGTQLTGTLSPALATAYPTISSFWSSSCVTNCTSRYAGCDMPERAALVDLWSSTYGPGWLTSTNWLSSATPCSWAGVSCATVSGSLAVVALSLPSNGLVGTLPSSIYLYRSPGC